MEGWCVPKRSRRVYPRIEPLELGSLFFEFLADRRMNLIWILVRLGVPKLDLCADDLQIQYSLHPGRLTWNLQITYLERKMIFQTSTIMFHVNLPGCTSRVLCVLQQHPFFRGLAEIDLADLVIYQPIIRDPGIRNPNWLVHEKLVTHLFV